MYKIASFRYESVIQKFFSRLRRANFFCHPPPPITNPFLRPCPPRIYTPRTALVIPGASAGRLGGTHAAHTLRKRMPVLVLAHHGVPYAIISDLAEKPPPPSRLPYYSQNMDVQACLNIHCHIKYQTF